MTIRTNNTPPQEHLENSEVAAAETAQERTTNSVYENTTKYSIPAEFSSNNSNKIGMEESFARDDDIIAVFDHDTERLQEQEEKMARANDGVCAGMLGFMLGFFVGIVVSEVLLPTPNEGEEGNEVEESRPSGGVVFGVGLLSFFVIPFGTAYVFRLVARWLLKKKHARSNFSEYHTALTSGGIRHVVKPGRIGIRPATKENHGRCCIVMITTGRLDRFSHHSFALLLLFYNMHRTPYPVL